MYPHLVDSTMAAAANALFQIDVIQLQLHSRVWQEALQDLHEISRLLKDSPPTRIVICEFESITGMLSGTFIHYLLTRFGGIVII